MNDLHIRPTYHGDFKGFIEVHQCDNCGVIGTISYSLPFQVCPNCGHKGKTAITARWEEIEKVIGPKFVWYDPRTWFEQKRIRIGAWVRKETIDGI